MHIGKTDFSAKQRALEEQIDSGITFSHYSEQYPVAKKWRKYMQEVNKTRKKMLQEEQDTTDILEDLKR